MNKAIVECSEGTYKDGQLSGRMTTVIFAKATSHSLYMCLNSHYTRSMQTPADGANSLGLVISLAGAFCETSIAASVTFSTSPRNAAGH
eukprot:scaffold344499_cov15-Prasinocladus_malaysianus.AAC.1